MKKIIFLSLILSVMFQTSAWADKASRYNRLRMQPAIEAYEAERDAIPIYREKLDGEILGFVHAEDAFTNNKSAIFRQMRKKALSLGADAIMEFKCTQKGKSIYQQCEGFAIKLKEPRK